LYKDEISAHKIYEFVNSSHIFAGLAHTNFSEKTKNAQIIKFSTSILILKGSRDLSDKKL